MMERKKEKRKQNIEQKTLLVRVSIETQIEIFFKRDNKKLFCLNDERLDSFPLLDENVIIIVKLKVRRRRKVL